MLFLKSVQIAVDYQLIIHCRASQGIYALNSEIVLQANSLSICAVCVATHGGGIALHGESYIRVGKNATLLLDANQAFQRGGAIYANSAPGVVPVSNCLLQYDQEWEVSGSVFLFGGYTTNAEVESVYVSDARNCLSQSTNKNYTKNLHGYIIQCSYSVFEIVHINFTFMYSYWTNDGESQTALQREIMSSPNHVDRTTGINLNKDLTIYFIPGKQKRLPYTHAFDEFGSNIRSVFSVLINKMDGSLPVELNSFSKYTADYTAALWLSTTHCIPHTSHCHTASVCHSAILCSPHSSHWTSAVWPAHHSCATIEEAAEDADILQQCLH